MGRIPVPYKARPFLFNLLGRNLFGMNKMDFSIIKAPLNTYRTLNEFFTRRIDIQKRILATQNIVAPCEGKVIHAGLVNEGKLTQIKGITYSLDNLIIDRTISDKYKAGSFCNIYLSPRNYHRFHVPCSGIIEKIEHIPGACYPVNRLGQKIKGLYTLNERFIVSIKSNNYNLCLAIIGATAVREITLFKKQNDKVIKGEELGMFQMGSSIVMLSDNKVFSSNNTITGYVNVLASIIKTDTV
ncbi:MAG: archaetidylserine decarboxylase [bacterium]